MLLRVSLLLEKTRKHSSQSTNIFEFYLPREQKLHFAGLLGKQSRKSILDYTEYSGVSCIHHFLRHPMNSTESSSETPFSWEQTQNGVQASKESYFAWASENTFANPTASTLQDYLFAVSCNIQDQAACGLMIDVAASQGSELIYRNAPKQNLNKSQCDALAKQVLGL